MPDATLVPFDTKSRRPPEATTLSKRMLLEKKPVLKLYLRSPVRVEWGSRALELRMVMFLAVSVMNPLILKWMTVTPFAHPFSIPRKSTPLSPRSEEHTSELQSRGHLVCRLLLEKKNK